MTGALARRLLWGLSACWLATGALCFGAAFALARVAGEGPDDA